MKKIIYFVLTYFFMFLIIVTVLETFANALRYNTETKFQDDKKNKFDRSAFDYIILTFGESTSASYFVDDKEMTWSNQLNRLLSASLPNYRIKVINKAVTGTNTFMMAINYERHLLKYKPDLVLGMVGINDNGLIYNIKNKTKLDAAHKIKRFVIFKIYNWLIKNLQNKSNKTPFDLETRKKVHKMGLDEILNTMEKLTADSDEVLIEHYVAGLSDYNPEATARTSGEVSRMKEVLEKLLLSFPSNEELVYFSAVLDFITLKNSRCEQKIRNLISLKEEVSEVTMAHYVACNSALGNKKISLKKKQYTANTTSSIENTYINIHYMIDLARLNDAKIAFMQYPLTSACRLQELLKFNKLISFRGRDYPEHILYKTEDECILEDKNILIIENKKNFEEALLKYSWESLFTDKFTPVFGHFSNIGHRIVARRAHKVLLPRIKKALISNKENTNSI